MNKKNKRKKIVIIIICILLLITLITLLQSVDKNEVARKREENLISSEDDSKADGAVDVQELYNVEKGYEDSAITGVSDAMETEGEIALENSRQSSAGMSAVESLKSEDSRISIETEHLEEIAAPDMSLYSHSTLQREGNIGTSVEKEESLESSQELAPENKTGDIPENPAVREPDTNPSVPDEIEDDRTAFEKAQEESENNKSYYYYIYLNELSAQEKQELYDSAPTPAAFLSWISDLRKEYEKDHEYVLPEDIHVGG